MDIVEEKRSYSLGMVYRNSLALVERRNSMMDYLLRIYSTIDLIIKENFDRVLRLLRRSGI